MKQIFEFKEGSIIYVSKEKRPYQENLQKASFDDIISIECDKPYVKFHLKTSKSFAVEMSLLKVGKNLKEEFVKVNRQVIVNMKNAQRILLDTNGYSIQMLNGLKYKISIRLVSTVRAAFCKYVGV